MPNSFGASTIGHGLARTGPRAAVLDEDDNPTTPSDHDCVKTLHLALELCPAIAIIDLPNADVNGSAHQG